MDLQSTALRAALAALFVFHADAAERSRAAVDVFKREHPCPATGRPRGQCPGYVVDHVVPLCAGGGDTPRNMQWQTVADAKLKDREENATCRALRRKAA